MFKKFIYICVLLIILGGGYYIYLHITQPKIEVVETYKGQAISAVYGTGVIESRDMTIVSSLVQGRITKFYKNEGEIVRKGDLLVELDSDQAKATLESMLAQEKFLTQEVKRQKALIEKKFTSVEKFEDRQSQYEKIKADIKSFRKNIDEYTLKAPKDGVVIRREHDIGEVLQTGKPIYWIGEPSFLRINGEIDEESLPELQKGQKVFIKADAYPKQHFEGIVEDITLLGNSQNKNYRVYIGFLKEVPFSLGMTVEINILTEQKDNVLLVPNSSFKTQKIWIVDANHQISKRKIQLGIQGDALSEVKDGLVLGDKVILKFQDDLKDEQKIRPIFVELPQK
ncbi:MAG: efflux RND transporter periplasmic adaptor subunit [Alphaproteobacteria bacterium]|nr:efflux RND transporter periplasmic adaptor subunit [Alphaproteobacteria bacterium]